MHGERSKKIAGGGVSCCEITASDGGGASSLYFVWLRVAVMCGSVTYRVGAEDGFIMGIESMKCSLNFHIIKSRTVLMLQRD